MTWSQQQQSLYRKLRDKNHTQQDLIDLGMIPKSELEDNAYYLGVCRNTTIAMWVDHKTWPEKTDFPNKVKGPCFFHMRKKFDRIYVETIGHPEDERYFDAFIPIKKIS